MNKMRSSFFLAATVAFLTSTASPMFAANLAPRPSNAQQPRNPYIERMIVAGEEAEKRNDLKLAERYYRWSEVRCAALKQNNQEQMADILSLCAKLYKKQKKYDQAIGYASKLLELEEKLYGKNHMYIAESMKELADIQAAADQLTEARATYLQAADLAGKASAKDYYWIVSANHANSRKKLDLVVACYDGYVKTFEKVDDGGISIDDAYRTSIESLAKVKEKDSPSYNAQMVMLDHYRDYLSRANRPEARAEVDKEIDALNRRESINQTYSPNTLPKS